VALDISSLLASVTVAFAEALGNASATGFENFGRDILKIVAGFAKQYGEILVASGFATLAFKQLIKNPVTAIAAGAALIAVASAASASLNKATASTFGGPTGGGGG